MHYLALIVRRSALTLLTLGLGLLAHAIHASAAEPAPAIAGYSNYDALHRQVDELAKSPLAQVTSLGKTLGGREVLLISIGTGKRDEKPALLIVGNVHAPQLVGSELALRVAQRLAAGGEKDEAIKALLDQYTFYVIPRPTPDASEAFFRQPYLEREGNERPTDDDHDGKFGEDPPDDLNGDGFITQMRVTDPAGRYMPHPNDPRVMIEANPLKNEHGLYTLYSEGKDDDGDGQINEDGPGGVAFNRNFTFRYPYFKPGAGPHQVSEVETRAVADFAFGHPNIAAVFTFTPEDNLMHPWKPGPGGDRIKTTLASADSPLLEFIAEKYRDIHGGKDAPPSPAGAGSFSEWAYFHYGRWSFAARGWWIPKVAEADVKPKDDKPKEDKKDDKPDAAKDEKPKPAEKIPVDERAADQLNTLRWFEREGIDGFVPWKAIEQPDFPGKKVEVGGIKPFLTLNPPAKELDPLAEKHTTFVVELMKLMPHVKITDSKVEPLGGDLYRVSATVVNSGFLPTMSAMGKTTGEAYPLQIKLEPPAETKFIQGHPRTQFDPLAGNGGKAEFTWIIRTKDDKPAEAKLRVWAPAVGADEIKVELKAG